jgi:hypothetical protein
VWRCCLPLEKITQTLNQSRRQVVTCAEKKSKIKSKLKQKQIQFQSSDFVPKEDNREQLLGDICSCELLANFSRTSRELLANFSRTSRELLANFSRTSCELLANFSRTSCLIRTTFLCFRFKYICSGNRCCKDCVIVVILEAKKSQHSTL